MHRVAQQQRQCGQKKREKSEREKGERSVTSQSQVSTQIPNIFSPCLDFLSHPKVIPRSQFCLPEILDPGVDRAFYFLPRPLHGRHSPFTTCIQLTTLLLSFTTRPSRTSWEAAWEIRGQSCVVSLPVTGESSLNTTRFQFLDSTSRDRRC